MISLRGYFRGSQAFRAAMMVFAAVALIVCAPAPRAYAQTYTKLYDFGTNTDDPRNPDWAGIFAQGRDGNLYSTSQAGGIGYGTVFQLTPGGAFKVLYDFPLGIGSHGGDPSGGLTLGTDGYLYGTTHYNGSAGAGTVFKIATDGTPPTTLHSFTGPDGSEPLTAPIQGLDGNFYGTTHYGHAAQFPGTLYKMTPKGVFKTLYEFDGTHGSIPTALLQGTDGNFYGTTRNGGTGTCPGGCGVIFKMTAAGKVTVLHNFAGTDGNLPYGPMIQAGDGNFYGTTEQGGSGGYGVVYKMTPAGVLTVLFNFQPITPRGNNPFAGLVQGTDGKFYGAALTALAGHGVLYQIDSAGTYTIVYTFTPDTGQTPVTSLFQHTNGVLYGDTYAGGTGSLCSRCGVTYKLDMGLGPFVSVLPFSSKVGKTVAFLGQGFSGTTKVSFNGAAGTFKVVSDTYLTATVPSGAKTGSITVTTPGGALTSNKNFLVIPQITSFAPLTGPVGTQVVITGLALSQATKVTFGTKAATFTVNSDTQVTATVPAGAKTGKITLITPGGKAASPASFTVTP